MRLAPLLLLAACTTVIPRPHPATDADAVEINDRLYNREVEISHGAVTERGTGVKVDPSRTTWTDELAKPRSLPTEFLTSLRYAAPRGPPFTRPGFWIGAAAGATLGAVIGVHAGDDTPCQRGDEYYGPCISLTRGQKAVALGLLLGVVGGGLGGWLLQEREELKFTPQ